MDTLTELAVKYKADKWGKHNYTPFYYKLFNKYNKQDPYDYIQKVKLLELGVAEGASLFMWRDFFKHPMIFGAEIDFRRVFKSKQITVYKCDQREEKDLINLVKKVGTDVDIFIDDGSHKPEDQVFTCLTLMPLLDYGVTYIIEDVSDPSIMNHFYQYDCTLHEFSERYDDKIIIVKHKDD